jgi:hypothetical protein
MFGPNFVGTNSQKEPVAVAVTLKEQLVHLKMAN